MSGLTRHVMTFYVPTKREHLDSDEALDRSVIPLYISPTSISMRDAKKITDTMTKGGYSVQYWGEALTTISVNGTTGSGGIEAIYILREVYRNEHIQIRQDLVRKMQAAQEQTVNALNNESDPSNLSQFGGILDDLSGGITGNFIEGTKSLINNIVDSFDQLVDENIKTVVLAPSLAAYAVSMDMYHQGEKFRGYFKDFTVNERGETPGLFNYSFNFTVLKRSGKRVNFMPWHRNPRDSSGSPRQSSSPSEKEFSGSDRGLSFAPTYGANHRFQSGDVVGEAGVKESNSLFEDGQVQSDEPDGTDGDQVASRRDYGGK